MAEHRLIDALDLIDAANALDTARLADGTPAALAYGRRMSVWLARLEPRPSEALAIAVRAQHIERWRIPRTEFPMDRAGYHRWRTTLGRMHAERAGDIARQAGYDDGTVARVQTLVRKDGIKRDGEVQTLEDVACLTFLEGEFANFARRHDEAKIIDIVRKTWAKMSARGHALALTIDLSPEARTLVDRALGA